MSADAKEKQVSPAPVVISRINATAALLTALSAGTLVTFAGGAVTLFYFWGLGGVPFGQASSVGAMAGVVLPTALFLFCVFLGIWLVPSWMGWAISEGKSDASTLNHVFVKPCGTDADVPSLHMPRLSVFAGLSALLPTTALLLWFAFMQNMSDWAPAVLFLVLVVVGAGWVWWALRKTDGANSDGLSGAKRWERFGAWLLQFVITGLCSTLPFGVLLLVAGQGAVARGDDSNLSFVVNAALIALMLWAALVASYIVQLKRKVGQPVNWVALVGINAVLLTVLMFHLGVSGRTLDVVMVLSSVRAEGVNMTLSDEGCEILAAMNAQGMVRSPSPTSKTCVLRDVILESALEPNIQVACMRPVRDQTGGPTKNGKPSKAEHFTLPSKFVLSVWKPSDAPNGMGPVCPPLPALAGFPGPQPGQLGVPGPDGNGDRR